MILVHGGIKSHQENFKGKKHKKDNVKFVKITELTIETNVKIIPCSNDKKVQQYLFLFVVAFELPRVYFPNVAAT